MIRIAAFIALLVVACSGKFTGCKCAGCVNYPVLRRSFTRLLPGDNGRRAWTDSRWRVWASPLSRWSSLTPASFCGHRRKLHEPSHQPVGLHHLWRRHLVWVGLHRGTQPDVWERSSGGSGRQQARGSGRSGPLTSWCLSAECDSLRRCQWKAVPGDQRSGCGQVPGMLHFYGFASVCLFTCELNNSKS